eukprot:scaffold271733_cov14-Prasinocladus_malaysianus.AAC.1
MKQSRSNPKATRNRQRNEHVTPSSQLTTLTRSRQPGQVRLRLGKAGRRKMLTRAFCLQTGT